MPPHQNLWVDSEAVAGEKGLNHSVLFLANGLQFPGLEIAAQPTGFFGAASLFDAAADSGRKSAPSAEK